ncbi:MAG: alpha-galactosidase, partial [Clostridia bacterium]|nr:alpha-galactosidase [Clostridia bacterium]
NVQFHVDGLPEGTPLEIRTEARGQAEIYTLLVGKPGGPELDLSKMVIHIAADASEAAGRWYPQVIYPGVKQTWNNNTASSYISSAPVYSYYRQDDTNCLTAAVDDCFSVWNIRSGISEHTKKLEVNISHGALMTDIRVVKVFVDTSDRPYYQALRDVTDWWAEMRDGALKVPDSAYDPVYSTWYTFHINIDEENVLRQCELAKELGCRTVFVDDGWATPRDVHIMAYAGDWKPNEEKFPDIRRFVERVHALGMKAVLWIAPGNAGFESCAAKLYHDRILKRIDASKYSVLDLRYPEIRANLCWDTCRIVEDYGFDGLKIDFIDVIGGNAGDPDPDRDFESVSDALKCFLETLRGRLQKKNPDVLIEYRQSYTGPDVLATANMVRSGDCAQDFTTNRLNTIHLRLHTNVAVHADMVQMIEGEDAEKSALQITGILFSTPQISVDLDKISEEQRKMLRFWLGFMSEKRELLQKSSFEPSRGYANFPAVTVRNASERLTALYAENLLMLDEMAEQVYIVNAYDRKPVYLGCAQPAEAEYTILNCMGEETARGTLTLGSTPTAAEIPFNGMMILKNRSI